MIGDRLSLQNLLNVDDDVFTRRGLHYDRKTGRSIPAPLKGWSDQDVLKHRLQSLVDLKSDKLRNQNTHPLGTNPMSFYEDMAAINQGIPALSAMVAGKTPTFASGPRVSTVNPQQAAWNGERIATAQAGARRDAAQARDLEIGNTENQLSIANEMADPNFGNMDVARANYGQHTRRAALARQYSGGR